MEQQNTIEIVAAIRKRPAMYVGSTSVRGFTWLLENLIRDIFGSTKSQYFSFELIGELKGNFVIELHETQISDTTSIAFDALGNDSFRGYEDSFQGCEFLVLNALSKSFVFRLFDRTGNELLMQRFEKGILLEGEIENQSYPADRLEIAFDLDGSIFDIPDPLNANFYHEVIRNKAFLHKGKTLTVVYPVGDEFCRGIFRFDNGLADRIEIEKMRGLGGTYFDTYFERQFEEFFVEAAFGFREHAVDEPFSISYVNEHYTHEGGTHIEGLLKGITSALEKYTKDQALADESHFSVNKLRNRLLAAIHLRMKRPNFEGSVKNKLISPEVVGPIANFVGDALLKKLEDDSKSAGDLIRQLSR